MATTDNEAIVRRYLSEAWSEGNLDALDALVAPDFVRYSSSTPGGVRGVDGLKEYITRNRAAFGDFRVTVDELFTGGDGDKVAVRWTGQGTHTAPFMGAAPTGTRVQFIGINIVHLRDGKLVEEWSSANLLQVLQQLGIMPGS